MLRMNIDHGRQGKIEGREAFLIENRIGFDGGLRTSPIWPGLLFYRSETQIGGGPAPCSGRRICRFDLVGQAKASSSSTDEK